MAQLGLPDLLRLLATASSQPPLTAEGAGFTYIPEEDDAFIPPSFWEPASRAPRASVILVEARAAVGKSILARHLAWATGGLLWDLSEVRVGSGTLWGSLAKAFGARNLNSVIGAIVGGQLALIVDALDEAEVQAPALFFDAFLDELRDMFRPVGSAAGGVLLGRTETIDYVEMFLGDDFPYRRIQIENFDRSTAYQLVDSRLAEGRVAAPGFSVWEHRGWSPLYDDAREQLFALLTRQLLPERLLLAEDGDEWEWPERVKSFLGYAPVLEALAEYLADYHGDYRAVANDLQRLKENPYPPGQAHWGFLWNVVTDLLLREQGKVIRQIREALGPDVFPELEEMYSPDEQCERILARVTGRPHLTPSPVQLAPRASAVYERALSAALPNHPFLGPFFGCANVVFRDYLHAWALAGNAEDAKRAAREILGTAAYLPSPLLGPFVLGRSVETGRVVVDSEDVGFVYESLMTQGEQPIQMYADEDEEEAGVYIGSAEGANPAVFAVADPMNGVQFWRRLADATIRGDLAVRFGLPNGTFSLGPNVDVDAALLEVPAASVRIHASGTGSVELRARAGYLAGGGIPEVVKYGQGDVVVDWDDVRYPWIAYAGTYASNIGRSLSDPGDGEVEVVFRDLCRLGERFAMSGRDGASGYWGPVTRDLGFSIGGKHGVGFDRRAELLVKWLRRQEIVIARGAREYLMDTGRLGAFGVRLYELCMRVRSTAVLDMACAYVRGEDMIVR